MTIMEQLARKRPLPDEPYDTMYLDGYNPYEILETAQRAIIAEHEARNSDAPIGVNLNVEVRKNEN